MSERITLELSNALGDAVVMTAAVRDLAQQYPGRYQIGVWTNCQPTWDGNPYARKYDDNGRVIQIRYGEAMKKAQAGHKRHFLGAFYDIFAEKLGISLEISVPKPDLYPGRGLAPRIDGPYWIIAPGWKPDMPAKAWSLHYWQKLVEILTCWGIKLVQVGAGSFINPKLTGVTDLVGHTTEIPGLFELVSKAEGVICGITSLMHIAAAFEKPCVVIAGGREAWWWEAYTNENPGFGSASGKIKVPHRYLHTIGQFSCCEHSGCCKNALVESRRHPLALVCTQQTHHGEQAVSSCLASITPEIVCHNVLSYYIDGTLPRTSPQLKDLPMLPPVGNTIQTTRPDGCVVKIAVVEPPKPALPDIETVPTRAQTSTAAVWADPLVGGKVTLCILGYGDHFPLLKRCLDGVLRTTAKEQVEIRVGGNALCRDSINYLELLQLRGDVDHLLLSDANLYKYPVMRRMFREPPLQTDWLVWLDDDAEIVDSNWLDLMLEAAITGWPAGARWVGPLYRYGVSQRWKDWCEASDWYKAKKRPWPADGNVIFCSGGLWLAHVPTLMSMDIPDARLENNKGDVTIGLQMYQAGAAAVNFAPRPEKRHVRWSNSPRRGVTTIHPAER